jgi:hypothetical protein
VVAIKRPLSKKQRKLFNFIKASVINLVSLVILAGLATAFFTQKTPWLLGKPSPSIVTETRLVERLNDEVSLPSGLGSIDDNGNILAWLHTETSGTIMEIKLNGPKEESASIILKEYSLFVYADSNHQVWLHRGQKVLQAFNEQSEIVWEYHFDNWPENAWASKDGHILTSHQGEGNERILTLFNNQGEILWYNILPDLEPKKAFLAPQGQGILLFSKIRDTNSDYDVQLFGPQGFVYDSIHLPSLSSYTGTIYSDGQKAYVSGDRELYVLENPEKKMIANVFQSAGGELTETENTTFKLPAYANLIRANENSSEIAIACWDEVNKTGSLLYLNSNMQTLWSQPLEEKLIDLGFHGSGLAVYGGSANYLFTFTNNGAPIWSHHMIEVNLINLAFSDNGRYVAALDNNHRVIVWQMP